MSAKKVFVSYSHDSPEHATRVRALGTSLSRDGCDCRIDVFKNTGEDWPTWMTRQLTEADFVLCVVTETYARRFGGNELPDVGLGVGWEAGLIRRLLYAKKLLNDRIFPVVFGNEDRQHIPLELEGYDFFLLDGQTGYENLLRKLLNRPLHSSPEIGTPPSLETHATAPLFARPDSHVQPKYGVSADISRIIKYAPAELIGRETETKLLSDAWDKTVRGEKKRPHVLTFVALGGEGKTSLVAKWAAELAHQGWPGCDAAFAWSFYSQGTREQVAASSDLFLKEALTFFGDDVDKEFAASAAGAFEKGQRLARIVGRQRNLLILDGLEPLQYPPGPPMDGRLKDDGVAALLKGLAATSLGLCVVTTRYSIPDLRAYWQSTAPEVELLSLSREAGVSVLQSLGVNGSLLKNISVEGSKEQVNEFEKLVEDVQGHALTLNLLGSYLRDAHAGDIRKRDLVKLEEADIEEQSGHAFRVMDAYVQSFKRGGKTAEDKAKGRRALALLRLLGLFDRPATADCLDALWHGEAIGGLTDPLIGLNDSQRNLSLTRLEDARLITVNRNSAGSLITLDAHPLIREYFARQVRRQHAAAWRAAHKRLYEHLCATTPDKPQPTLEDLQPLYQAVAHGCQAGMQEEVLDKVCQLRIWRRDEVYTPRKLGLFASDLGAIACFFEKPWSHISPALSELSQGFLLNNAAYCLRALGRLTEALEPMRTGLKNYLKQKHWAFSARLAGNLSELDLTLGEVAGAVKDGGQSVTYADRSSDAFIKMATRATHADALHQAGRRAEAKVRFRESEQVHANLQPKFPIFPSPPNFNFCELLVTNVKRAAWRVTLGLACGMETSEITETYQTVEERAGKTLSWDGIAFEATILSPALDHLTMARAALYAAILEQNAVNTALQRPNESGAPNDDEPRTDLNLVLQEARRELDDAVDGLRRANRSDYLPIGLLTRAWLRFLSAACIGPESAQEDLDEAWEIAERGPMRLHMADIHLYRARLFGAMKDEGGGMRYPWDKNSDGSPRGPKDDLSAARKLIEQCGYWRRKEELEDAEEASKNW